MTPPRIILPLLAVFIHTLSAASQEPVAPYDATGRYLTSALEVQATGALGGGRDILLAWGAMRAGGPRGQWMQRTELAAGIQAGQTLIDRLMAGPQLGIGLAMPGAFITLERGTRAEPYLLAGGGALGVADVADERLGISPNAYAGLGLRLFDDEWDVALTHLEVIVQQRFGAGAQGPELYLRVVRSVPPGGRAAPPPIVPLPGGRAPRRPPRS
jgi:hypothetical protein